MRTTRCNLAQLEKSIHEAIRRDPGGSYSARFGGAIEELVQQIGNLGGVTRVYSDSCSWFRVVAEGDIIEYHGSQETEHPFRSDASSEGLVLAYLKTYKLWKDAYEKFLGKEWKDPIFRIVAL